uniref:Ig-like domain-containing protein n=1 Tax=Haemonchus contortus TaxID=6289 RepID=A0A7I5E5T3_HAECO
QEGYENTTKDINLDVSTLHIHVTRNERYRCYSKGSEYYRADEDVRLFPLEEQPDNPEVELRLERTQPPTLHIKWSVNWIVDAPISKRALIDIKEGNAVPARLEFAEKNHGEAVHRIQESNVAVDVIVTAYYNEYLNTSRKEEIVVQDIAIKNLQHKLESKQILLQWEIEGALPYEELKHFLSLEIWQRKWLSNSTFDITPQNTSLPSFHTYEMDLKPFFETSPRVRLHLSPVVNKYKGISASRVVEILQNPLINVTELWVMKGTNVTIRCREPSDHYYWVYQEGYESTTKDMSPDVSTLTIRVTRNERYRCYSKGIEYYRADEDVRLVPLEEPPDYPEVELRLERSLPPKLHIKWIANWIADAPMSKRALIDIKKRNAAPTRLEFAGKNDGEVEHQIDESKVEIVVIVTAYYNEYLNPSKEDKIVVQDILIKNLKHKLERKRIYLQWEVEGAQPYEKLNYLLRTKSRSNTTTKDVGNRTSAVLSFDRRIGNHTLAVRAKIDSYSGPISEEVSIFVPDVRVKYLRHKMHKNEIFLEWEVRGYLPFEEPSFILSIRSRGNTIEKDVGTAKSTVVQIDRRNREYELAVKAVVDSYEGPVTAASIHVPEFVLNRGPENLNVKVSAALISIEFEPVPANEFRMFGEDKGCKIIICNEKEVSPKCVSQHAAPQFRNVEFHDLEEYNIYHATGECYTGAGAGPRSPWLLVVTGTAPIAEITAEEGLNLIISWSISTETGLPLNNSQIKNVEIAQFAKDEHGSYTHGLVVSKSKERQIDTGMSPAYKFDTGCYIFTLNATLRNKMTVFGRSSEICYSWTSPSFVILYTAILIILIAIAVMVFSNRKRKMKMSTTKPPPAKSTTTSKSSTSSTTKSTITKKDKSLHKMEGKSKTPSETVPKAIETKGSKPPTKAKGDAKGGKK